LARPAVFNPHRIFLFERLQGTAEEEIEQEKTEEAEESEQRPLCFLRYLLFKNLVRERRKKIEQEKAEEAEESELGPLLPPLPPVRTSSGNARRRD
jgi:hypothetical protein